MPGIAWLEKAGHQEGVWAHDSGPISVDGDKLTGELNYGREKWKPWNTGIALDML